MFPPEVLFLISAAGNHSSALAIMQSCKRVRDYFYLRDSIRVKQALYHKNIPLQSLYGAVRRGCDNREVMRFFKQHIYPNYQLDAWIVEPAPLQRATHGWLIDKIVATAALHSWDYTVRTALRSERRHEEVEEYFITGGCVTQVAFGTSWETDIDVFVPCREGEEDHRQKLTISDGGQEVDLVFKNVCPIQTVLRHFDISLCQIGVLRSGNSWTVFATPLFLASLESNFAAVQVADITFQYRILYHEPNGEVRDDGVTIDDFFLEHINWFMFYEFVPEAIFYEVNDNPYKSKTKERRHTLDFLTCERCRRRTQNIDADCHLARWFERVDKYQRRFPHFSFQPYFAWRRKDVVYDSVALESKKMKLDF